MDMIERDYLTHIVIRMFENMEKQIDDEHRFRIEVLFSPGVHCDPYDASQVSDPPKPPNNRHFLGTIIAEVQRYSTKTY
eukprot:5090398-Pyramimonas_sp.AAC.1